MRNCIEGLRHEEGWGPLLYTKPRTVIGLSFLTICVKTSQRSQTEQPNNLHLDCVKAREEAEIWVCKPEQCR